MQFRKDMAKKAEQKKKEKSAAKNKNTFYEGGSHERKPPKHIPDSRWDQVDFLKSQAMQIAQPVPMPQAAAGSKPVLNDSDFPGLP